MSRAIKLLKREEIDDKLWNGCVHFAVNSLPYGYTWYLDNIAENWEGLVLDEYQAVFPLVWKEKMGVKYIHTPPLARQLGLYAMNPPAPAMMQKFVDAIPAEYKDVQVNLNALNSIDLAGFRFEERQYHILDLQPIHSELTGAYSDALTAKLKAAYNNGMNIKSGLKPEPVVELFEKRHKLPEAQRHTLHRLIYKAEHYSIGQSVGVYKDEVLLAAAFFMFNQYYLHLLVGSATEQGSKLGAYELLIDHMIRTNAGSRKVLDFGGLNRLNIHDGFGTQAVDYWQMRQKKVPWYLQFIK